MRRTAISDLTKLPGETTSGTIVSYPPTRSSIAPVSMPCLAEVQRDVALLEVLPVSSIVALRRQVSHLAADLDAAFCQAMAETKRQHQHAGTPSGRLLTPAAAADRFGVSKRWLLDHADDIGGVRRLSRKVVRFSERHLERFFGRSSV